MAICAPLTGATNLDPSCDALRKRGGAGKAFYILAISQIAAFTISATTKELTGITLKTGEKALKFTGKKLKNSTKNSLSQTNSGPSYAHGGVFEAFFSTQLEKETIEAVALADDLVLIAPLNSGQFEVHGMVDANGDLSDGLIMTYPESGSGTGYEDSTSLPLTFDGSATKMPIYASFGVDRAASFAYLEAMLTPAP